MVSSYDRLDHELEQDHQLYKDMGQTLLSWHLFQEEYLEVIDLPMPLLVQKVLRKPSWVHFRRPCRSNQDFY